MQLDLFIARFHPLVVHLPIGFLLLAVILELTGWFLTSSVPFKKPVQISLIAGLVASVMAVVTGLILQQTGNYNPETLYLHRSLGIALLVFSALALLYKTYYKNQTLQKSLIGSIFIFGLLSFTGHLGGVLTHGESYLLDFAPESIRKMAGIQPRSASVDYSNLHPDSVLIYRDMIAPLLHAKCAQCHSSAKTSGKLKLEDYSDLFQKSESGFAIVKGNFNTSELFARVTLPPQHKNFMPPKGKPLSFTELAMLRYWIEQGADSASTFDYGKMNSELTQLIRRDYGLDFTPKPYYESVRVDSISTEKLQRLQSIGIKAQFLGETNFLLDVTVSKGALSTEQLGLLEAVTGNITFLDMEETIFTEKQFEFLKNATHLTRLDLHESSLTDAGLDQLMQLEHLEVLNLYGTQVTEQGLAKIASRPNLKRIYVWKTAITSDQITKIQSSFSYLSIITGATP